MHFHLNSTHWDHKLVKKIENDSRIIYIFASKDKRDKHNKRRLKHVNTKDKPIAIFKSVPVTSCKTKARDHYDNDRCPSKTCICVGCKVSLVGVNMKPEWDCTTKSLELCWTFCTRVQLDCTQKKMQHINYQDM